MAFCPNCGAPIEDGARFCTSCGFALGDPQPAPSQGPADPRTPQGPADPRVSQSQRGIEKPEYQQLGGWLLFFVICWGLSALSGIGTVFTGVGALFSYGPRYAAPMLVNILVGLLSVGVSVLMVLLIVKRNPMFLRLYQLLSLVEIAASVVSGFVSGLFLSSSVGVGFVSAGGGVAGGAVGLCLMTLYFCRSVRVRTYMGSTEYLDQALFRLGE